MSALPLALLAGAVALVLALITLRRSFMLTSLATGMGLAAALGSIPWAMNGANPAPDLFAFAPGALGFIGLILAASLLCLVIAQGYWQGCERLPREEFPLLLLVGALGASALAASASFITLFLGLETMTLAMIGMIAYPRARPEAEEAGLKYLILSGMSSGFLLFGMGLIELATGSLSLPQSAPISLILLAGIAMISIAAGFKLSVVPFHIWVPDVYAGAPAPAGAYAAVIPKIAVLAVLVRLLPGTPLAASLVDAMTMSAILSMLIGNLLALLQDNIKRLLGYSSIAHLGYLLVAILAAGAIGQVAVVFYTVTYAITMVAAFGVVAALSGAGAERDADKVSDLRGLFWIRPGLAAVMTLALLSLAGIPPAIGFIAKMYIMAAGIHTNLWWLIGTMVASSIIGLFYYLNIIIVMSLKPGTTLVPRRTALSSRVVMALVCLPMLGFGVAPQPLIGLLKAIFG